MAFDVSLRLRFQNYVPSTFEQDQLTTRHNSNPILSFLLYKHNLSYQLLRRYGRSPDLSNPTKASDETSGSQSPVPEEHAL